MTATREERAGGGVEPIPAFSARKRVLLFEPNPVALSALAEILRDEGYAVEAVSRGGEIVSRLGTFVPDVLLMDIDTWRPSRDPAPSADSTRCIALPPSLPVVGMSSDLTAADSALACVLRKAVDVETLLATLDRVTEGQSRSSQSALLLPLPHDAERLLE